MSSIYSHFSQLGFGANSISHILSPLTQAAQNLPSTSSRIQKTQKTVLTHPFRVIPSLLGQHRMRVVCVARPASSIQASNHD